MTKVTKVKTTSETQAADIAALLRARNSLLWIVTKEEARVERYLFEAAGSASYLPRTWDAAQGVAEMDGRINQTITPDGTTDIAATLTAIRERAERVSERGVWIMRDLPVWLNGPIGMTTLRQVRNLARYLPSVPRDKAQALIVLSPSSDIPPEIEGHATVIEWPMPDRAEIASILDAALDALPEDLKAAAAPNGQRDQAIDAAIGLSGEEAAACYAKSLVQLRRIDPVAVSQEKKRVIAKSGVLEWSDPLPGGLDAVGGLDGVKRWLLQRASAWTVEARAYGLPAPKGLFLVGISGCGKSLIAKAISAAWQVPLLRLDLGGLRGKYVGESEANLRKAFRTIEACGRVVVLIDEIEKALAGATQGAADGGVSADALGALLTFMQERKGEAFFIATANSADLPPEIMRKGRWDDLFWIDLPTPTERAEILLASLRKHGRKADVFKDTADLANVAAACDKFTGSEVAELVPTAMFAAFGDGRREVNADDLLAAAKDVAPLAETAKEKIDAMRKWAKGRARMATTAETPAERRAQVRALDI